MDEQTSRFIVPDWPAPSGIVAAVTTRFGGVSTAPYDEFNLATHVGDDLIAVHANRRRLKSLLDLPSDPLWLDQVHGTDVALGGSRLQQGNQVVDVFQQCAQAEVATVKADACYTTKRGQVCVVLTADCLPILFCDEAGTQVAAAHAGWRGLANGIVEQTLGAFHGPSQKVLAWLGPAISKAYFEVGPEVKAVFEKKIAANQLAFTPSTKPNYWFADLFQLARNQLKLLGVEQVYGGQFCTFSASVSDTDCNAPMSSMNSIQTLDNPSQIRRFYSYRRDGATGRIASLIWRNKT